MNTEIENGYKPICRDNERIEDIIVNDLSSIQHKLNRIEKLLSTISINIEQQ